MKQYLIFSETELGNVLEVVHNCQKLAFIYLPPEVDIFFLCDFV